MDVCMVRSTVVEILNSPAVKDSHAYAVALETDENSIKASTRSYNPLPTIVFEGLKIYQA